MKILKQKYHGLPGLGINGKTGKKGQNAQSIFFGYINDFFDGQKIDVKTYIYVAKRTFYHSNASDPSLDSSTLAAAWKVTQQELGVFKNNTLQAAVNNSSLENNNSYIDHKIFYYTGTRLTDSNIADGANVSNSSILDNDTIEIAKQVELDLVGDYISMSFMLNSLEPNFNKSYKNYKTEYDASLAKFGSNDFSDKPIYEMYNLVNHQTYYSFDNGDVLMNFADTNNNWHMFMPFDTNDAVYYKSPDKAGPDLESGELLNNQDCSNYYTNYPEGTTTNYVKEDNMVFSVSETGQDKSYFALDTNISKAILSNSSLWTIYDDNNNKNRFLISTSGINNVISSSINSDFENQWNTIYKTSFENNIYEISTIENPKWYEEHDLLDSNNNARYGIASPYLYKYKGTENVVINDSSIPSAADQTYKNSLHNANHYGEALINTSDGLHVYYSLDDNDTILFVPSTLKDIYNVGDVLYFYTSTLDFNGPNSRNYQKIVYMVVLTEDLLHCTPVQLMNAAQLISPLEIKYFSTNNDNKNKGRLCNNQNIAVLLNPCLNGNDKFINKSFINVANNYAKSLALLAGKNNSKLNNLIAVPIINGSTYSINSLIKNNNLNINCSTYIKVNQLCVNTNKLSENTNIELFNHIYDRNIKFYSDSFIKPLTDIDLYTDDEAVDDVNYLPYVFSQTINGDDYFYDIKNLDNYFYGCDIYNKNMELIQTITSNNEKLVINLIPSPDSDIYYFQIFASYNSGIKYYSKISQLDLNYVVENVFLETKQIAIPKRTDYTTQIEGDSNELDNSYAPTLINEETGNLYNQEFTGRYVGKAPVYVRKNNKSQTESNTNDVDTIEYKNEDIFVKKHRIVKHSLHVLGLDQQIIKEKKSGNIFFDLSKISVEETPDASLFVYPTDSSIVIDEILFNHNNINNDNKWNNSWIDIWYDESITDSSAFNIDLSSNLPVFIDDEDKIESSTLKKYIMTGWSDGSKNDESLLFALLNSSTYIIPESKQRSVLVTAKYHYINVPNEYYYENFNIVQPGFKDSRGVPEIKLHAHTAMQDLQAYNSIENGVLSNQFVTYLDIDIKDFKKQWAQFSNDASILLDISIFNIDYDLNWQYKYVVEDLTERRTFRTILEQAPDDGSITQLNNYVKISTSMFETDKNLMTLNTTKCCSTNGNLNCGGEFVIDNYFTLHNAINTVAGERVEPYADEYILCDSSFINIIKHSNTMYKGLQDNIIINLSNIPICDDIDTIKLKILIEMGNPMLSNLYFRFAVKHVGIKVQLPGQSNSSIFETNALNDYSKIDKTYLANSSTDADGSKTIRRLNYRFISDPIDITFNPLSYTICPNNVESSYTNIYSEGIYKYGINNQIQKELKFFNTSIYENNPYNYTSGQIKEESLYPFTNLYIKKSYIQDNIKQINIKPISLYDSIYKANIDNIDTSIDNRLLTHNVLDFIEGNKYLSIVYHSTIMQPKIRNDVYNFYYNDDLYLRSKYNQKLNNMPIFAYDEQSIELRDDILINSMDKWNDYYAESIKYDIANTYQGVLSLYGNGYTQILESDVKNASFFKEAVNSKDQILSLNDVKKLNDISINLYTGVNEVDIEPMKSDQPNNGEYFRGFLYDINWEFPYYDNTNIIPYRIVSPFDNFLNNTSTNIPDIYQKYYNALIDITDSSYGTNMVPYNLLFDLNPRIAYNYETDGINVLMLRRPSIGTDTDNINNSDEFKEKYEFSHQLFDLTDNIEKLKSPYTVK